MARPVVEDSGAKRACRTPEEAAQDSHIWLEAKVVIDNWRQHYNAIRPHSSLNYGTPIEFKNSLGAPNINEVEASR